ncbi:MAG: HAD family phosphatase [Oscillospiraceae bacterium]|nr:HAD family phosphatase [Oscillospiraceae bacterium]MBO7730221.1 HAD family phosphatase [Lachnospiraceae bacterium]
MVKLIACDIDGTVLEPDEKYLPHELLEQAERLMQKGIAFCFSSGRQFSNLRVLAEHLVDRFYYICDNGAVVYSDGRIPEIISQTAMDHDDALQIVTKVIETPGLELEISNSNTGYLYIKTEPFQNLMLNYEGMNLVRIRSPRQIPDTILKISVYSKRAEDVFPVLSREWGDKYHVAIAGEHWVDITLADKGTGVTALCRHLGVGPESVVAFGDNYNDIPILDLVGYPYMKSSSPEDLLKRYPNTFTNVVDILKTF